MYQLRFIYVNDLQEKIKLKVFRTEDDMYNFIKANNITVIHIAEVQ
jgi:hypothetical protein